MPEAKDGLRSGKLPRKAGLILDVNRQQYSLNLNAEALSLNSAKLPDVEDADSPRTLFEERIGLLRDLCKTIDELYGVFLKTRASANWESHVTAMRRWILQAPQAAAREPELRPGPTRPADVADQKSFKPR
jgi:hypothetical protein